MIHYTFETLLVLEIVICADFQFLTGIFIADDIAMLVHLQHAGSPHVADTTLNHVMEGAGFLGAVAENQNLTGSHHSAHADSECLFGYQRHVAIEETAVSLDGVGREGFDTGL